MEPSCSSECQVNSFSCPYKDSEDKINPNTLMPYSQYLNSNTIDDGLSTPISSSLPVERESSTIPKGVAPGLSDGTWKYPSPKMFYHALLRKGYETDPKDIESMLSIHNQLNEGVWEHIVDWEQFSQPKAKNKCLPILKRFRGRPQELSPKAWFSCTFLGAEKPFDRHDWVIDRCGKEIRYIIDYYEGVSNPDGSPTMNVCVRPALDNLGSVFQRVRRSICNWTEKFN